MRFIKITGLMLITFLVCTMLLGPVVYAATEYKVSGKITIGSSNGQPLAGAIVSVGGKIGITDFDGEFDIYAVPSGIQIMVVEKDGYNSFNKTLSVSSNLVQNAFLTPGTFTIQASAGSGGTIAPQGTMTVAAGSSKTFTITPNPGYIIETVNINNTVQSNQQARGTGGAAIYSMTDIQSNKVITATFKPSALTLSGKIITSTGSAISGAAVKLVDGNSTTVDPNAMTDSTGNFILRNVKSGPYTLQVIKAGYNTINTAISLSTNISGLQIALNSPSYAVTGKVTNSANTAIAQATVSIAGKTVTTNSAGNYNVAGIAAGTYTMTVSKPGYATVTRSVTITSANQTQNFTLAAVYAVSGKVTNSANTAIAQATVTVAGKTATTDSAGNYSVSGIAAGTYTMTVSKSGYTTVTRSVTITSANQIQNFTLAATYTVSGKVTNSANTAIAQATVTIAGKTATTNSTGNYSVAGVAAGTYTMTVSKSGYNTATRSISINNANQTQNFTLVTNTTATIMKSLVSGQIVSLSDWNNKAVYANYAFMPITSSESNDGITTAPKQTIQFGVNISTTANIVSHNERHTGQFFDKYLIAAGVSPKQVELDNKLRTKENELLAKRIPQRKGLNSKLVKAPPASITVGTPWTGVKITTTGNTINATCRYISNSAYFFVDNRDTSIVSSRLAAYATAWEGINSKNRQYFGNPNINGVQNSTNGRVIILFSREVASGYLGYFYSGDKFTKAQVADSNEADIFYLTTGSYDQETIMGTLAHEFQHMIYFDQHHNRGVTSTYKWLNEGLSGLAEYHNGYNSNHNAWMASYLKSPLVSGSTPLSLTYWTPSNYGLSGLYVHYLRDRFGDAAVRKLVQTDKIGIAAVETATLGSGSFNTIYQDFSKALVLSNTGYSADAKYKFTSVNLQTLQPNGRKGLMPYLFTVGPAPVSFSYTYYPYQLDFWKMDGVASNMRMTGTNASGTAYGLPQ